MAHEKHLLETKSRRGCLKILHQVMTMELIAARAKRELV